jgi:hypothetical protein
MCLQGLYRVQPRPERQGGRRVACLGMLAVRQTEHWLLGDRADERVDWDLDSNTAWSAESIVYCAIFPSQRTGNHFVAQYDSCSSLIEDRLHDVCRQKGVR